MAVLKAAAIGKIFNILDKKISSYHIKSVLVCEERDLHDLTLVATECLTFTFVKCVVR